MHRLQIELILGFEGHKSHGWPLHRLGDCFSILVIILVGLHERPHELRWNQAHLMPLRCQSSSEMMRATTRFHADEARWRVGKLAKQLAPRGASLDDDVSGLV